MKPIHSFVPAGLGLLLASCAHTDPAGTPESVSFDQARRVLEASCVHCHGSQRIAGMPSFASTRDLAALTGPGRLIVPGAPAQRRVLEGVTR